MSEYKAMRCRECPNHGSPCFIVVPKDDLTTNYCVAFGDEFTESDYGMTRDWPSVWEEITLENFKKEIAQ